MNKEVYLTLPVTEQDVRNLNCGDIVYLTGDIFTLRDRGHRKVLDMIERNEKMPIDFSKHALWHCGPIIVKDDNDKWVLSAAGSTTSSRFSHMCEDFMLKLGLRIIIGKGIMYQQIVDVMQRTGAMMLNTTGGCAALYAEQVEEVIGVHWLEIGMPEAMWMFRVKNMGPLIVSIDSHGESFIENTKETCEGRFKELYKQMGINETHSYVIHPEHIIGRPWF